ncbi:MAG: S41 family peptidase, partial [Bacteroidota bacterium]
INSSFEIFGDLYKKIANNYVIDVDLELLMESAIEGMLSSLDPYTVYYTQSDYDELEYMTRGTYVGLGISVAIMDSMLTITDIREGYPADKAGLRIGDRIYMMDSTKVLHRKKARLRDFTGGKAGSRLGIKVLRDGLGDTLRFTLERQEIRIKNVPYSAMLKDSIAYIKLDGFTEGAENEVRKAVYELCKQRDAKGIILDLRDNPGGLLQAAVEICQLFVPKNSTIVSTKGRDNVTLFEYRSSIEPMIPDLPLAVLINEGSASASEVVAGAIQDLDRGIIIGKRSFGKGLVQNVFGLPYDANLKMTTAKYFTPSGRCIQRISFGKKYDEKAVSESPDTSVYYTGNKRPVKELTGIMPDSIVREKVEEDYFNNLKRVNYLFKFANIYTAGIDSLNDYDINDEELFNEFLEFITSAENGIISDESLVLEDLIKSSEKRGFSEPTMDLLANTLRALENEEILLIKKNKNEIITSLKREIYRRFYNNSQIYQMFLTEDRYVELTLELLKNNTYMRILTNTNNTDESNY